jgi:eukaryotic-like serine/threonine-protein kinase
MSGEEDVVDRLAESIADGNKIDWAEVDKIPVDDHLKQLLDLLRIVDGVADLHRSIPDEPAPAAAPQPDTHTTPVTTDFDESPGVIGQWGKLALRRKIGEGSFGEVFHAHDSWLDHPVALKLFKPSVSGRIPTTRILHEARKLARVRHPNVVVVHGADSHDGRPGFWMDLIEGTTLEVIVRQGRLSAGEASIIGQEVCRALAAVHVAGIVHRDVKAQNVMRAADGGRIILMDFGAGEFIKELEQGSSKQGTPLYLAPELFENADASVRTDIYAVGVLLFFLVTCDFPVRGSSFDGLRDAHRRGERRRLRDIRPDLPGAFVSVVERALDPDPARRFASAGEMESALGGNALPIPKPTPWVQTLVRVSLVSASVILAVATLGLIACRTFEVALGVEPQFSASIGEHFSVGVQALLPFVMGWLAGGVVLMAVTAVAPISYLSRALLAG